MLKEWLAGACLAPTALTVHADPQSTCQRVAPRPRHPLGGDSIWPGRVTFYAFGYPSRQHLGATLLRDFQQQDTTVQPFTLADPASSSPAGRFTNSTPTLSPN